MKLFERLVVAVKVALRSLTRVKSKEERAKQVDSIIRDVGGIENIRSVFACASRLRLTLNSTDIINQTALTQADALCVIVLDEHHAQIIYGPKAYTYAQLIEERLPC